MFYMQEFIRLRSPISLFNNKVQRENLATTLNNLKLMLNSNLSSVKESLPKTSFKTLPQTNALNIIVLG